MSITNNLKKIKSNLPKSVQLVAVSKTKPIEDIKAAYDTGHRDFGENKAQELQTKQPQLPDDIKWHMIGHLQRNKVKYIAPYVYMIHAVDSFRLAKEINKQSKKHDRTIDCLLQFHIAEEETKFGFSLEEFEEVVKSNHLKSLENVCFRGVMGMATYTDDETQVRREFQTLKKIFDQLKEKTFKHNEFNQISMGMSHDYKIAIEEGSTLVRIGSSIFGARN